MYEFGPRLDTASLASTRPSDGAQGSRPAQPQNQAVAPIERFWGINSPRYFPPTFKPLPTA
ncbi:uncharacterized protein BKA78DRAFT_85631 [Phyllosticta capitalensis]|uniref:uncharacterized protein n=1 Tax=Phyllosticta capitalensis TaxID=121624 RepID=UPI0031327A6D